MSIKDDLWDAHSEIKIYYYKDGNLEDWATAFYWEEGKLKAINGEYVSGTLESYHDNGEVSYTTKYCNGLEDGIWEAYYSDGQLKSKEYYENGEIVGVSKDYHKNGQLKSKRTYKDGIAQYKILEEFRQNGSLRAKETFKDGILGEAYFQSYDVKIKTYDEDGELKYIGNYKGTTKDGEPYDGYMEQFHVNGNLIIKGTIEGGSPKGGIWRLYWDNGRLRSEGYFKEFKKEGLWVQYYESGKLSCKEHYRDGELDGPFELYHENGRLKNKGTCKNGIQID